MISLIIEQAYASEHSWKPIIQTTCPEEDQCSLTLSSSDGYQITISAPESPYPITKIILERDQWFGEKDRDLLSRTHFILDSMLRNPDMRARLEDGLQNTMMLCSADERVLYFKSNGFSTFIPFNYNVCENIYDEKIKEAIVMCTVFSNGQPKSIDFIHLQDINEYTCSRTWVSPETLLHLK